MKTKGIYLRLALLLIALTLPVLIFTSCQFCPHSWGEEFEYRAATCAEEGITRRTCKICGANEDTPIESPRHGGYTTVRPTCTEGGYTLINCPECGYEGTIFPTEPKGHKQEDRSVFCSVCREVVVGDNIFLSYLNGLDEDEITIVLSSFHLNENITVTEGEITLAIGDGSDIIGSGTLTVEDANGRMTYDASITDGICYLYAEPESGKIYHRIPLSAFIGEDVTGGMLPGLDTGIGDTLGTLDIQAVINAIGEDRLNRWLGRSVDLLCRVGYYNYAYTFTLDADKMKAYNARLAKDPLAKVIDDDFGDGSFALIAELLLPVLDDAELDLEDIIAEAEDKTLYELMGVEQIDLSSTVATVDAVIDALLDTMRLSFTGNEQGELLSVSLSISGQGTLKIDFTDHNDPTVDEIPGTVESLREVSVTGEKEIEYSVDDFLKDSYEHYEFVTDSNGRLERITVTLITAEFVDWSSDKIVIDGIERYVTYYDVEEITYSYVLSITDCETVSISELCCGWYIYGFQSETAVTVKLETYVATVIGNEQTNGEKTLVGEETAVYTASVSFLNNRLTGEVMHPSRVDEVHEFTLKEVITAESCLNTSYDIYACVGCGLEEKRNETMGDNHVPGDSGWCTVCFRTMWCPDSAVYTYESESGDVRCELYENKNALVHDKYDFYTASWYEKDGKIYVHLTERNDPYIVFVESDGVLTPAVE